MKFIDKLKKLDISELIFDISAGFSFAFMSIGVFRLGDDLFFKYSSWTISLVMCLSWFSFGLYSVYSYGKIRELEKKLVKRS